MTTVLVVDDNEKIVTVLTEYLKAAGFHVMPAVNGSAALNLVRMQMPDLALVDIMLPGADGYEITRAFQELNIPVILVTAKTQEEDRIYGLEVGADDYITKPFSPREVVARVKALLRRIERDRQEDAPAASHQSSAEIHLERASAAFEPVQEPLCRGNLCLDFETMQVTIDEKLVELTHTEFTLLTLLAEHPGRVFSRERLLFETEGEEPRYDQDTRVIDAHVKNIRRKLGDDPRNARYVQTVIGSGYRFNPDLTSEPTTKSKKAKD